MADIGMRSAYYGFVEDSSRSGLGDGELVRIGLRPEDALSKGCHILNKIRDWQRWIDGLY